MHLAQRSSSGYTIGGWHSEASPRCFFEECLPAPTSPPKACVKPSSVSTDSSSGTSEEICLQEEGESSGAGDEAAGLSKNIQVYLRIRPCSINKKAVAFQIPDSRTFVAKTPQPSPPSLIGNANSNTTSRTQLTFHFDRVFPESASQDDVFDSVAAPMVDSALRGVNGTIFAYGQSGSGKTFTITGGSEAFEQRGLIPRCLARVFDSIRTQRQQCKGHPHEKDDASPSPLLEFTVAVSYLEIYRDKGYDLLTRDEGKGRHIEDLRRVQVVEDEDGRLLFRGLSINRVNSEEDALMLLFLGDTNRIVAETNLNDCSTRSHCIFTLWLASREQGSSKMPAGSTKTRRAKLHLVDLAGSERVKETPTKQTESLFRETCSINLSLHYLEQVITALKSKTGAHVPYRNSALTTVLKDSLGGNCSTRMIATISSEADFFSETLATCKFAQDVAKVKNAARTNVEEDPTTLIRNLLKENKRLKILLKRAAGGFTTEGSLQHLSPGDKHKTPLPLSASRKISESGTYLLSEEQMQRCRDAVEEFLTATKTEKGLPMNAGSWTEADFCFRILREKVLALQLRRESESQTLNRGKLALQLQVEQRDRELSTLLGLIRGGAAGGASSTSPPSADSSVGAGSANATALLVRGEVFESLRRSIRRAESVQREGQQLRELHAKAAEELKEAEGEKRKIAEIKLELERLRSRRREGPTFPLCHETMAEETSLLAALSLHRDKYLHLSDAFAEKKSQLLRLQNSLDRTQQRLRSDFEAWIAVLQSRQPSAPTAATAPTSQQIRPNEDQSPDDAPKEPPSAAKLQSPSKRETLVGEPESHLAHHPGVQGLRRDSYSLPERTEHWEVERHLPDNTLPCVARERCNTPDTNHSESDSQLTPNPLLQDEHKWNFMELQSAFRTGDPAIDEDIAKIFAATDVN